MLDLINNGIGYLFTVVVHISDVTASLAHRLPSTDIHRRCADEGTFTDGAAGVSHDAGGSAHQGNVRLLADS
jgi:hypothetical protein